MFLVDRRYLSCEREVVRGVCRCRRIGVSRKEVHVVGSMDEVGDSFHVFGGELALGLGDDLRLEGGDLVHGRDGMLAARDHRAGEIGTLELAHHADLEVVVVLEAELLAETEYGRRRGKGASSELARRDVCGLLGVVKQIVCDGPLVFREMTVIVQLLECVHWCPRS